MLEVIFSSFWTWLGTVFIILSMGWAASMPIVYFCHLKKIAFLSSLKRKDSKIQ